MPNPKDMQRYQQMLDELSDKYPELKDPIANLEDAMMESMDGEAPEDTAEEGAEVEGEDMEFPPMPPKKKPGVPEEDEEEMSMDEEGF